MEATLHHKEAYEGGTAVWGVHDVDDRITERKGKEKQVIEERKFAVRLVFSSNGIGM